MENAARVWFEGDLRQRQQIQPAIFPAGPPFNCEEFGATASCLAFMQLEKLDQADGVPTAGFDVCYQTESHGFIEWSIAPARKIVSISATGLIAEKRGLPRRSAAARFPV
jgi:hypothetical protein